MRLTVVGVMVIFGLGVLVGLLLRSQKTEPENADQWKPKSS
jgi:hypothetical protein